MARGFSETMSQLLVPIHGDGHKFLGIGLAVTIVAYLLSTTLFMVALALMVWLAAFFRDPPRVTPLRSGLVVAPADGRIVAIEAVDPPAELGLAGGARPRVSICLSLLDVHVNRAPVAGRITRSVYVPGAFFNAAQDRASEDNERRAITIETTDAVEVAVVQIAGMLTRRIVTVVGEGDTVGIGERIGLIRFGSRVDLYLPPSATCQVLVGQRAVAGETVIADLSSTEPEREGRRS